MLTSIVLLTAALPFAQGWSDTGLISRDDDWAGVAGVVGHRGDGLVAVPGADPRLVVADGAGTPVDVNANETEPRAVGLAAGVTEFELQDPVVALQGSATAGAPHLVMSLDTRGRSVVTVSYRLRDVDASSNANAVQAVALQYRVGASEDFAAVPGGFVADATTGPGAANLVTPVSAVLPAAADDQPLVQLRILTTDAVGEDEWVGVDDIEVETSGPVCGPSVPAPPEPGPSPPAGPPPTGPPTSTPPRPSPAPSQPLPPALTGLTLSPATFTAAKRGPAVTRSGRSGTSLRFRLSRPATVELRVTSPRFPGPLLPRAPSGGRPAPESQRDRNSLARRGRRLHGPRSARRPRDRPFLGPRPPRYKPFPLHRKAARPRPAGRSLPPDGAGGRPQRSRFPTGGRRVRRQVSATFTCMSEAVGVAELRRNLSIYLRRVNRGERLLITDRNRPVAELGPARTTGPDLDRLVAAGRVSRPVRSSLPEPLELAGDPRVLSRALDPARGER